jgi:GTP-binding protein EngB required for normal cell division
VSIAAGARRVLSRPARDRLEEQVEALAEAVRAAEGRLDPPRLERAREVIDRAHERLRLSGEHTVVTLAGATGSGKSSLFNRLSRAEHARVGVRRPTTSRALACTWSADGASELLDWLGVDIRHQIDTIAGGEAARLQGLVLLDLPDHDSTEVAHHVEMERMVARADLLVWVLDPQKYADAAIHERFLRPLATHSDVMLVVLNHVDAIPVAQRKATLNDVRRLLREDGLADVPLLATSATTGEGVDELVDLLATRVAAQRARRGRLAADVRGAAEAISAAHGDAGAGGLARGSREKLVDSMADAAGVPALTRAVERSAGARARQETGWPATRWLGRLRPDPLRSIRVGTGESPALVRSSVPHPTPVQQARVDTAVREVADSAGRGLSPPWVAALRRASLSRRDELPDALDQALVGADVDLAPRSWWWTPVRLLQWLLLAVAVAGAGWLLVLAVLGYLQLPALDPPQEYGVPLPTAMLAAGALGGIVLAAAARLVARWSAKRWARKAGRVWRARVAEVAQSHVVDPMEHELAAHERVGAALQTVLRR